MRAGGRMSPPTRTCFGGAGGRGGGPAIGCTAVPTPPRNPFAPAPVVTPSVPGTGGVVSAWMPTGALTGARTGLNDSVRGVLRGNGAGAGGGGGIGGGAAVRYASTRCTTCGPSMAVASDKVI